MLGVKNILLVALGGALGAVSRFSVSNAIHHRINSEFPWGTLAVNCLGSFIIGFLMTVLVERFLGLEAWRLMLVVGFLGAFTTYSSFSYETLTLFQMGNLGFAVLNVVTNTIGCLMSVYLGAVLGRLVWGSHGAG
jgi:fluoride exporter